VQRRAVLSAVAPVANVAAVRGILAEPGYDEERSADSQKECAMRRFLTYALTVALAGTVFAAAAEKAKTADDIDKAMKKVGTTQQTVNKMIQSMQYADAKKNVEIIKTALTDAENFWTLNKKDDAVKFSKDTLAKLDVLDKALAEKAPDAAKVGAAYKEAAASCAGCHRVYRGVDANNQFIIKPGTV
jgi:cytochrome c556